MAAALIVLAVLAWAVAWREAAFMTALAIAPVAVVWLVSQGAYSYFFPRYLLFTVGAWAVLAGIGLSRLDVRIAAAAVLVVAILGAGDQQVIREPARTAGRPTRSASGGSYRTTRAPRPSSRGRARPGDGIVYQGQARGQNWLMIGYGLQYYLARDHAERSAGPAPALHRAVRGPGGHPLPACRAGILPPAWAPNRGSGSWAAAASCSPYRAVTPAQAAVLRPRYRLSLVKHVARPDRVPAHPGAVTIPGEEPAPFGALVFVVTAVSTVD